MSDETTRKIRKFAANAIERRENLRKALNVTSGRIVEGMAAPRVFARFPNLKDELKHGINSEPLLLLVDLSPFSQVASKMTATQIAGFLDEYYASVVKAVEALDGVVEKYIGDAVIAIFGEPFTETTDELLFEVVEMAKRLIREAEKWFGGEVAAKVALAWGKCFLGYVGPEEHQELTVVGNALTTLFRLEAECEPKQVIALEELLELRSKERLASIDGPNPTWIPKTRSLILRGVAPGPVKGQDPYLDRWQLTEAGAPSAPPETEELAAIEPTIRAGAAAWIASADVKATALLAVAGALLAAVAFASGASTTLVERVFVLFFCLFAVGSIAASAGVLWPRTDRMSLLGSGSLNRLERSPTYFGEMGDGTYEEFRTALQNATAETYVRDAYEQTYIVLAIACRKMLWMRRSVALLATSLLLLAGFVVARAFDSTRGAAQDGTSSGSSATSTPSPPPDHGSATKH